MSATLAPPRRPAAGPPIPPLDPNDPPAALPRMSREEYLAFDNASDSGQFCYEWIDGRVRTMSGGTFNHHLISGHLMALFTEVLRDARRDGRPLAGNGSGLRTRIPDGPYYYPDALACPVPPEVEEPPDQPPRTLLNPVLLAEVLSPSTAREDRGEKRRAYHRIPTAECYLLVQPNVREVLRLSRDGRRWSEKRFRAEDGHDGVDLPRFDAFLPFDRLYLHATPGGDRV